MSTKHKVFDPFFFFFFWGFHVVFDLSIQSDVLPRHWSRKIVGSSLQKTCVGCKVNWSKEEKQSLGWGLRWLVERSLTGCVRSINAKRIAFRRRATESATWGFVHDVSCFFSRDTIMSWCLWVRKNFSCREFFPSTSLNGRMFSLLEYQPLLNAGNSKKFDTCGGLNEFV